MANIQEISDFNKLSKNIKTVDTDLNELSKTLLTFIGNLEKGSETIKNNTFSFDNLKKAQDLTKQSSEQLEKTTKKVIDSQTKLKTIEQQRIKIKEQQRQVLAKNLVVEEKSNVILQKGKLLLQQQQAELKLLLKAKNAERGSTAQLNAVVAILNKRLASVNQTTDVGKKKADLLRGSIDKLNAKITAQGTAMSKQKRNIGNYGSALAGVGGKVKRLALQFAGALGLTSVIFLFANALKSTFNRIRDFDSAMQNIAGIVGVTRSELSEVEGTIKKVASQSIKTSNEVAKLAEVLFTLGKSRDEVIDMLAPVNNLAIGLQTTSENAAELLGQTLNAFGKGSESAAEFADIIANMRTSTALNFERIKDALGFLAPTANALNLTLGKTGALIGVLQDNGVKASRAGALLNTSFARLVGKGLTLEQALTKINESTDKVGTSSDLFGKRAFGLGLILADNVDRVNELGDEFDNLSTGSLKKLTDEQLKSMDSQLKILDSTWEKFVLDIDSGSGIISVAIRGVVKGLIVAIDFLGDLGKSNKQIFDELREQAKIFAEEDSLAQAFINDRKEVENIAKSLIEKGVPAIDANRRAAQGLIIQYQRLIGYGVDNSDQINKQIDALRKFTDVTIVKTQAQINAEEAAKDAAEKTSKAKIKAREKEIKELIKEDEKFLSMASKSAAKLSAIEREEKEKANEDFKELNKERLEDYQDNANEQAKINKEKINQILEDEKEASETQKELQEDLTDAKRELIQQGVDTIFDINSSALGKKSEQLEQEKALLLSNDQLTSEQREKIEADFALKQQKIAKKQKAADKVQAAVNVGISTATSLLKIKLKIAELTAASALNPLLLPLIPLVAAQIPFVLASAGLSLAAIAAFSEGTENTPDRFVAGDKKGGGAARELMFLRDGSSMMVDKPTYFEGSKFKGATIKSNPETEKIMSMTEHRGYGAMSKTDERLLNKMDSVRKAIERKPVAILDKNNNIIGYGTNNHREYIINQQKGW